MLVARGKGWGLREIDDESQKVKKKKYINKKQINKITDKTGPFEPRGGGWGVGGN